jgi:hypothetical protein
MPGHTGVSLLAFCLIGSACPARSGGPADSSWLLPPGGRAVRGTNAGDLEPHARGLALALVDPSFRHRFGSALVGHAGLPLRLDHFLPRSAEGVASMPVAAHRRSWGARPAGPVLMAVATPGLPLAFDLRGGRHRLDPTRPPETPVIVLGLARPVPTSALPAASPRLPPTPAGTEGASRSRQPAGTSITPKGESL